MTADEIRVAHEPLRKLCAAIQLAAGVPAGDARVVADLLVEANLAGVDTHGVIRLKLYVDRIHAGGINVQPHLRAVRENACTALLDGDNCLGPVGGTRAMDLALAKASITGLGVVAIRNCNHYGPAGHYARLATARSMIGIAVTNTLASMPPTGGAEARQGNNAYSIGFPAGDEPAVVVDGATSRASWGKVFLCAQQGEALPADCYVDRDGAPTVNPQDVMAGGGLLPFAGHKGYGLAVAFELLTGMLAAAPLDHEIPHPYKALDLPGDNTFFMGAIDTDCFAGAAEFKQRMDEWVRFMRATRRAPGAERVWLPGEKEAVSRQERLGGGIPLGAAMMEELAELAQAAGVAFDTGELTAGLRP